MDTQNSIDQYRQTLYQILHNYCEVLSHSQDGAASKVIVSEDHTRYLLITEGWSGNKRVHDLIFEAEIRNDNIWLHYDGLDHGITPELIAAGVPQDRIVLAFHPPHVREHTGYAIA